MCGLYFPLFPGRNADTFSGSGRVFLLGPNVQAYTRHLIGFGNHCLTSVDSNARLTFLGGAYDSKEMHTAPVCMRSFLRVSNFVNFRMAVIPALGLASFNPSRISFSSKWMRVLENIVPLQVFNVL